VKHPNFLKQEDSHTTTLSLADLAAQFCEERFHVAPLDVATGWVSKDQFEGALVPSLHGRMVPQLGTTGEAEGLQAANV